MAVSGSTASTGVAYDLISEGEIELVDGLSSIYLNRTPIVNSSNNTKVQATSYSSISLLSSTTFNVPKSYAQSGADIPVLVLEGSAEATVSSETSTGTQSTVVTGAAFFTSAMINGNSAARAAFAPKIRIQGAGVGGAEYVGSVVSVTNTTTAVLKPAITGTAAGKRITFDYYTENNAFISSNFGNVQLTVMTLDSAIPNYTAINARGSARVLIDSTSDNLSGSNSDNKNFDFVLANFRSGTLDQEPVTGIPSFTNASLGVSKSVEIKQYTSFFSNSRLNNFWGKYNLERPSGATGGPEVVVNASEIAPGSINEVDELLITIGASGGLYAANAEGNPRSWGAVFQIYFKHKNGTEAFKSELIYGPTDAEVAAASIVVASDSGTFRKGGADPTGTIRAASKTAVDFDFRWSIEQYKPFTDFQIAIRKVTPDNLEYNNDQMIAATSIKSVQAFINDKLSYPHAAYAAIGFDSQEFAGEFPERAYHCYGVRTQIPTNYVTREEADDGIATYTRNVSTGAITSDYQIWDGALRTGYTNNPVWNLREILVNKRWGLGHWMSADYINDYSLYSLARYCDELVPDGTGGLEPRFTCGVYLTSATEAYKVVKDFATIMLALPYWVDGQLILEGDRPGEPVYAFTKGNIEGGLFSYEGTGNKTRPNQIVVRFNNRENFYEQDVELVDDVEDMVIKNRIFSEEVTAFGATSRSQAIRYGKWKLLTAKMQKEIVNFKTGEGAAYIKPGSIVTVQDADKNSIRYSGRIASATTSQITVDSDVVLYSGEEYTLHAFIVGPATFLMQPEATIGAVDYVQGDQLPAVIDAVTIDSEEKASAIVDDAGDPVVVQFTADAHMESKPISNSLPYTGSVLNVTGTYTSAPESEVVWAITVKRSGALVAGSAKPYKVLSIGEESPGLYNITAAEHYNSKFDLVDEEFITSPVTSVPRYIEIPPITDFNGILTTTRQTNDETGSDYSPTISLSWTGPKSWVGNIFTLYQDFDTYEITYTTPEGESKRVSLPKSASKYTIPNVVEGLYEFTIRAKSSVGPMSPPARTTVNVFFTTRKAGNLAFVLPTGGTFDRPIKLAAGNIETSGSYRFTGNSGRNIYVSAFKPLAIEKGNFWYDSANSILKQWNGTAWVVGGASYALTSTTYSTNESGSFTITLTTTGVADSTVLGYTITGLSSADIGGASLTGNFTVSSGTASAAFTLTQDETTEGPEIFTIALDNGMDYASISIADTSVPGGVSGAAAITLGDFGVAGAGTVTAPVVSGVTGAAAITLADFGISSAGTVTAPPSGITGTAAITLADFGITAAGTVGGIGGSAPTVVWAQYGSGSGFIDTSAQDTAIGDILIGISVGSYINSVPGGNSSVTNDGWSLGFTNGSSSTATTLSYLELDAGNIASYTEYRTGNGASSFGVFCVRGAELTQFASATNGDGYLEITDTSVITYGNTGTVIDTSSATVDVADSLVLSIGAQISTTLGYSAPSGYAIESQGTAGSGSFAIASKTAGAGAEDPGAFSGGFSGTHRGYTLVIAPV